MAADILIIDDEADIRELIAGILQDEGFETRLAHNSDAALSEISQRKPSLVILDIWLQGSKLDGLDLLLEIQNMQMGVPVIIISGHGNIETAVAAIKRGAYEYIEKPFNSERLLLVVSRALEATRLRRENEELKGRSGVDAELLGQSAVMRQLRQTTKKIASANSRVLITGPMGAGKELVARSVHRLSQRAERSFVVMGAAAMAPERMEEELFGIESHAGEPLRVGALEEAHGGTLYIDEVADMPLETQGKVLRVLVDQTFQRVGGKKKVKVDVRIITSTSRDLVTLIAAQQFREDLYHRLAVVPLHVAGLNERRDDIPELIDYFCKNFAATSGQQVRRFSPEAVTTMQTRDWPGNVRELRNHVERALILSTGDGNDVVTPQYLSGDNAQVSAPGFSQDNLLALPLREARDLFEREYVAAQLSRFGGNITKTAQFIGMERSALHRKIKMLGLAAKEQEEEPV
ncbi:sigma-54-dependent transcriptional regulator [Aestuariivirga litoralis]|uniref:nitrogen assimilation response regulator NtrX n=1 Tax=Aestuariivirga litoralis TaxID=2650924 RepID=UPI0018C4BC78|nr:sigma-54 dependent transcriptional regulator [Aestuariivirga litoralis]MBG1231573.1 sigma-54-dependent Fis family transcriptional regulator [Aestuariivirga litoralis]